MTFVHLTCQSDRSIGWGLCKPADLVAHYKTIGARAACITDSGNMNAAVQLYKECKAKKIIPVFGMIANVVPDMTVKRQGRDILTLIAINRIGFFNLVRLASVGSMFFYYYPRVDLATIEKHSEGLIAITGGLDGLIAKAFMRERKSGIATASGRLLEIFKGRVYHEIQPTPTEMQRIYNEELIIYCSNNSLRCVATGSPLYIRREDAELHRMLHAARSFKQADSNYSLKGSYHVKSYQEMMDDFAALHGAVADSDEFINPMKTADDIIEDIENFDLRDGLKVPKFIDA